jgi:hypothetical protein
MEAAHQSLKKWKVAKGLIGGGLFILGGNRT